MFTKPLIFNRDISNSLIRGLVYDAQMFERAGASTVDLVGKANGVLTNGPTWITDKFGSAISFDNTDDKIVVTPIALQKSLINISVEVMLYPTGYGGGGAGRVIQKGDNANLYWAIRMDSGLSGIYWLTGYANSPGWAVSSGFSLNAWNHFIVTHQGIDSTSSTPKIYLNGVERSQVGVVAPTGSLRTDDSVFTIGGRNSTTDRQFGGYIAYVRVWNRVLGGSEVRRLYSNPFIIYQQSKAIFGALLGSSFSQTLTETATLTDSILKQAQKKLSETITHTDTILKRAAKTFTETQTSTDTLNKQTSKPLSETVTHTDSITLLKVTVKTLLETITHSDTLTKLTSKVLAETATLTASIIRFTQRTFTETTTLTDTVIRSTSRIFTETITYTDSLIRTAKKTLSETITHTDSVISTKLGAAYSKILSETMSFTDSLKKTISKVLAESISLLSWLSGWFPVSRSRDATYNPASRSSDATYTQSSRSGDASWNNVNRDA